MNANELADGILAIEERIFLTKKEHQLFQNSATMLRQQQAEIEALKQIIDANNLNQNIGQFVKPTNKPVAWMDYLEHSDVYDLNVSGRGIPLYTHPVKEEHFEDEPQAEELHEIMQSNTHPVKEQYKFGVDWSKDGNAVIVLKICEDGVAEVVFMDYQKATHPVKEQDESFDRTASHMAGEYVSYKAELTDEEINKIYLEKYDGHMGFLSPDEVREFARAILRKAQE